MLQQNPTFWFYGQREEGCQQPWFVGSSDLCGLLGPQLTKPCGVLRIAALSTLRIQDHYRNSLQRQDHFGEANVAWKQNTLSEATVSGTFSGIEGSMQQRLILQSLQSQGDEAFADSRLTLQVSFFFPVSGDGCI